MATLTHRRDNGNAGNVSEIPAIVAGGATAVETNIEAAPVIGGRDHGGSFGIVPRSKIRGRSLRRQGESGKSDRGEQNILHRHLQFQRASLIEAEPRAVSGYRLYVVLREKQ
jgi:hypothetical protein